MLDVISPSVRSDRRLLVASLGLFAVAGVANTSISSLRSVAPAALAVVGVYALARYARRVDRRTLAIDSLFLWVAFLAISPVHAVGVATVAGFVPGSVELVASGVTAITWATLLGAGSSTAFLAFREYGAGTRTATREERMLEQEYDY